MRLQASLAGGNAESICILQCHCKTMCKLCSCSALTASARLIIRNHSRTHTSDSGAIGSWLQHQGVVLQDLGQVLALLACHLHMPYTREQEHTSSSAKLTSRFVL